MSQSPIATTAGNPGPAAASVLPSESGLIFCFADRFLAPASRGETSTLPPAASGGAFVGTHKLAGVLCTAALANLVRRAKLSLTEVEKKVLWVKRKSLVLKLAPGARFEDEPQDSLEYDFLKAASRLKGDFGPHDLVSWLYKSNVTNPWAKIPSFATANLLRAGLGVARNEQQGGIGGHLQHTVLMIDWSAERLASLAEPAATAWAAYQAWTATEPLAGAVLKQIEAGIRSRELKDNDSD